MFLMLIVYAGAMALLADIFNMIFDVILGK